MINEEPICHVIWLKNLFLNYILSGNPIETHNLNFKTRLIIKLDLKTI